MIEQHPRLSAEERREKHKVYLRDTAALLTLLGIAVALSFVTYGLFHSFSAYRAMLENRWRARGEVAMAQGNPRAALDDLHSALAYSPDDRGLQIELATALAQSGETQEAQAYLRPCSRPSLEAASSTCSWHGSPSGREIRIPLWNITMQRSMGPGTETRLHAGAISGWSWRDS